ncbi:Type I restriction enzyme specificity protein MPN_089 [Chryseobacterium taihuense]|uniref:Type I restriction enzyme specificity protein MPN_089 n=2 Tax=Chryseobacterium group TaxID=2782232 RepID=A0A4U8WCB0_9FLAO|nr:Type I restriction enzyme specificity protein MPN_089 [Chryseobacterium taihuense]
MEQTNKLVPELRFPEFVNDGEWEIKEVGDIFEITRGYVLSMNMVQNNQNTENPYPVYSSQTKNHGLAGYYSSYLYENAITWTTDGANAGDVNYREGKFYCTNVCGVLISKEGFANNCISEIINSVSKSYVSYVGNPKLMNGVMSKIKIPVPKINEQQKIADCLSSLDELITAHTDKLEALKNHKKGLLQNLFPQEGQKVPHYRFPEFLNDEEWEEKKLGNVCINIASGKDKNVINGIYNLFGSTGIIGKTNNPSYEGDYILVARVGANAGFLNRVNSKFGVSDNTLVILLDINQSIDFIYYHLENFGLNKLIFGSGQPLITGGQLKSIELRFPKNTKEQQKIAECLMEMDNLITAQTEKIEQLKTHKKGLMQGLFPNVKN